MDPSLEEELAAQTPGRDTLLSIGVFDGVHLGHQALLRHLRQRAEELSLLPGVVTFSRHPRQVLQPGRPVSYLTSLEERQALLRGAGAELVVTLTFTRALSRLPAREFLSRLQERLRMKGLVTGPDFALGRGREGTLERLRVLAGEMSFTLEALEPVAAGGEVVSSTAVRQALGRGEMDRVGRLLGRPFALRGRVVPGAERGRLLGFPTANLEWDPERALPADGVYVTRAYLEGRPLPSVTNIGVRPTFNGRERTVEVYLLDFQGDIYGRGLGVEFVARLRGERRFATPQQLVAQMEKDVRRARELLSLKS